METTSAPPPAALRPCSQSPMTSGRVGRQSNPRDRTQRAPAGPGWPGGVSRRDLRLSTHELGRSRAHQLRRVGGNTLGGVLAVLLWLPRRPRRGPLPGVRCCPAPAGPQRDPLLARPDQDPGRRDPTWRAVGVTTGTGPSPCIALRARPNDCLGHGPWVQPPCRRATRIIAGRDDRFAPSGGSETR